MKQWSKMTLRDYADRDARLTNTLQHSFMHRWGRSYAIDRRRLMLEFLHDHDGVPWRMFKCLKESPDGLFRWPTGPGCRYRILCELAPQRIDTTLKQSTSLDVTIY